MAQAPLPSMMKSSFKTGASYAEQMFLPVSGTDAFVRAQLSFENGETRRVVIKWTYRAALASVGSEVQAIDVSFKPTAIARRAGTSTRFYVVGWAERTGQVIVEEWTFGQCALGSTMGPDGSYTSTFSKPAVSREIIWVAGVGQVGPVWDAAFNFAGEELLMLENDGTTGRIRSLDINSLALTTLAASTQQGLAQLADHHMLNIGKPAAGGLLAFSEPRVPWTSMFKQDASGYYVFAFYDGNLDGTFESSGVMLWDDFLSTWPGEWDGAYLEP